MDAGRQLVGPRPPLVAPHREVVVLEQEDAHPLLAMELRISSMTFRRRMRTTLPGAVR